MDTLTQTDDKALATARRNEAEREVKTSIEQLQKGMRRFVRRNSAIITIVALGGSSLIAAGRLIMRRSHTRPRHVPRLRASWTRIQKPARRAIRAQNVRAGVSPAVTVGALLSAGALTGTGLTMLLAPRLFTNWLKRT